MVFVDARLTLPRVPGKSFNKRDPGEIVGFVVHQGAGEGTIKDYAEYHTSTKNHITPGDPRPGLCYTFGIERDGTIVWANDVNVRTSSQKGNSPVPGKYGNTHFMGIVVAGDFKAGEYAGGAKPNPAPAQVTALIVLIWHLSGYRQCRDMPYGLFGCVPSANYYDVWGHSHFGKRTCPGDFLARVVGIMRAERPSHHEQLNTARDWQLRLKMKGYDPGPIDGIWGSKSRAALSSFQAVRGLATTGMRDAATKAALLGD
jgi:N-acetylmuramoyl-L-alanine amidase